MINSVTHHSLFISALFIPNISETTCRRSILPVVGPEEVQLCYLLGNLRVHYWLASHVSARLVGISHNFNKSSLHDLFDMVLIILTINLFACLHFLSDLFICTRHFSPFCQTPLLSRGWVLQRKCPSTQQPQLLRHDSYGTMVKPLEQWRTPLKK